MSCARLGARICFILAFILITIAFSTPYWLQSDGLLPYQRFHKVGLWEICYTTYQESSYLRYNNNFRNCRWIFDRDYYYLIDLFETAFFIAVQVFFTFGFTALLVSCILILATHLCISPEKDVLFVRIIAVLTLVAAVCCTLAVVVFGVHGDGRDWMPDPDHNYLSWSFALGVVGSFFTFISSILFFIEASKARKREDALNHHVAYHMEQTHTKV
ncbi:unnamed protein product [Larinioides sclopetarius]|uniref:Uncharacterized protein n=1 Tax=Larinioides sclopetarius TaxID=280406 RepID=A0AAV1ZMV3_9ARAC